MKRFFPVCCTLFSILIAVSAVPAQAQEDPVVLEDGDVSITYGELEYLIQGWTPQMRNAAILDEGDRLELLNLALANKKVSMQAEQVIEDNPELYWKYMTGLWGYQRNFVLDAKRESIEVPDFTELALEEYTVTKEKIAVNPEKRLSSHILFSAPPGVPREAIIEEAQSVLQALRDGADFVEMVNEHSDEPNAAEKQGLFNYWMTFGDARVSPPYSEALFNIETVGEYSEITQTQFGVHIIRLDGIQPKTYQSFEQVKPQLVKQMEAEYRGLTMKDYLSQFHISESAKIDAEAVESLLAPYQQQE